jgi:hypothetical protein
MAEQVDRKAEEMEPHDVAVCAHPLRRQAERIPTDRSRDADQRETFRARRRYATRRAMFSFSLNRLS